MNDIGKISMVANDAGAATVEEYMISIAAVVWNDDLVKRPFGNSGWQHEVYNSIARAGLIERTVAYQDEDYIDYDYDVREGDTIISNWFKDMLKPENRADHAINFTEDKFELMHPPLCNRSECKVSKASAHSVLPVPEQEGRYPAWVDAPTGELKIGNRV